MTEEQRVVLVTGASSGIGEAIVDTLLQHGYFVIGVGSRASIEREQSENFRYEQIDLSDLRTLPNILKSLVKKHPNLDTLVCNAGKGMFGSLEESSYDQINDLIALNLTSQIYLLRAFMPLLKRQGRGDIVLIGSEAALSGGRKGAVYCATKFGLRGFAEALREEVSKSGIRVTMINPGMVKTPFFDQLSFEPGHEPCNYILPSDVADAVQFVLSSNQNIICDEINLSPLKRVLYHKPKKNT